ncbi:MAG: MetQ/NlpA family ABC transporter substrate-binding protein [Gammaproteobacteria bacterium]|nr:MetQ/NlpA family ABC transporter substrate-binding protein [Gammaproteobacteria bacterium]
MLKRYFLIITLCFLTACQQNDNALRVGTITGPETQLVEVAQQIALDQYGLKIKIIPFADYLQPNTALNEGSIDANIFQHQPWLDQQNQDHHYQLISIAKGFIYPMGLYPGKTKTLSALPHGAVIAIPNDPSNEGRALLLLQKAGLIQLSKKAGIYATPADIIANPKGLTFKELDAAQLTRSLADVDLAAINTNFAIEANLYPNRDALFHENNDSIYANIIVIRANEKNDPRIQQLVDAFHSDAVVKEADKIFHGQAIRAWH